MSHRAEQNEIYKLKLHDSLTVNFYRVLRVPGGWIYTYIKEEYPTSTFVPFDDNFQNTDKKQIIK